MGSGRTLKGAGLVLVTMVAGVVIWCSSSPEDPAETSPHKGAGTGAPSHDAGADAAGDAGGCERCNVLLVTFDALRADHLGAYGYRRNTSPQLDDFAAEAAVFSDAMSQSGSTPPSLISLHTSRFHATDRVTGPRGALADEEVTLAEVLRNAGYHTAAVVGHDYANERWGLDEGFQYFDDDLVPHERAQRTLQRTIRALRGSSAPFFLWVHFRPPHTPYQPKDEVFRRFYEPSPNEPLLTRHPFPPVRRYYAKREPLSRYTFAGDTEKLSASMVRQLVAMYDGNIRRADSAFARLLNALREMNRYDDTIVAVSADHGESMGEHQIIDHNDLYHGMLHVPLMVRVPGHARRRYHHPVMNVDIFPTILRLVGISWSDIRRRGQDLFDATSSSRFQYAEYAERRAIKMGRLKLIQPDTSEPTKVELYDLGADPEETTDLANERPGAARRLRRAIEGLRPLEPGAAQTPAANIRKRLRSLGYAK